MATDKSSRKEPGILVKGYLILYNAAQVLGWSYLLYQIVTFYLSGEYENKKLWDHVKTTVIIFQNAALLEIFHTIFGFVRSGVFLTAMQVYSRVLVVLGVLIAIPASQNSIGVPLALVCWSITEIIRYSFYALGILNAVPYFLLWCRYTFFIVLYPFGVSGELLCMYAAQAYVAEHKNFTIELPNAMNFTFSYQYFLLFNMIGYIPGFPQLYLHMFTQRKKIIGGSSGADRAKKSS
ncbi:very-long-chain (3R)-3-hydroxyacyl-CoA dehydratase hpo-8-like [Planococcus citri]|uniref:very-long-chain (3R)-3-hydroxyacyl-CoA dehydratase hpo-8-like n=1 Tax=Planococcus citri TaxID=170843 RepID=UPI0031F83E32